MQKIQIIFMLKIFKSDISLSRLDFIYRDFNDMLGVFACSKMAQNMDTL